MGVDLLSLSAHKFYGPKGVGALYVRGRSPRVRLAPVQFGGGQERALRPGTLNVPGIVGLGEACRLAREDLDAEARRLGGLRDRLEAGLLRRLPGVRVNGCKEARLPGTTSVSFDGIDVTSLLASLQDVALSPGSACTTGSAEPSYVLKAIGLTDREAFGTVRFSAGRFTTEEEIDRAVESVSRAVETLRRQMAAVNAGR
jgi:cysteine desulfurase